MSDKCAMCGKTIWAMYGEDLQRCPHCGSRRWNKDVFKGIADEVLLQEAERRGLLDPEVMKKMGDLQKMRKAIADIEGFNRRISDLCTTIDDHLEDLKEF